MAKKTLHEFLNTLPPEMRDKVQGQNVAAAAMNANQVNQLLDAAMDAALNVATVATVGSGSEAEKQMIHRALAMNTCVMEIFRAVLTTLVPAGGPREQMHMAVLQGFSGSIEKHHSALTNVIRDAIAFRARAMEEKISIIEAQQNNAPTAEQVTQLAGVDLGLEGAPVVVSDGGTPLAVIDGGKDA
jgi:hypothetical protein